MLFVCTPYTHARNKHLPAIGCAGCGGLITSQAVLALNMQWHASCFACAHCHSVLPAAFYEHNHLPYCEKDYNELFGVTCSLCSKPIHAKYLVEGDKKFHEECMLCSVCSQGFQSGL